MKEKPIYEQLGYDPDPPFYASTSKPIVTNYDRIISKTPEEMAQFLSANDKGAISETGKKIAYESWLAWLKQEESE